MIVVANTSPINYLAQIQVIEVLPTIYGQIVITPAVLRVLSHPNAPVEVQDLLQSWPSWLLLRQPSSRSLAMLSGLDEGELEAIQHAVEIRTGLLLIDERKGWQAALTSGLLPLGTLGVLLQAGETWLYRPDSIYDPAPRHDQFSSLECATSRFHPESCLNCLLARF